MAGTRFGDNGVAIERPEVSAYMVRHSSFKKELWRTFNLEVWNMASFPYMYL